MRRIIFHAGFHKTGTTALQQSLRANRKALRPEYRLVLRAGMVPLCEAARAYSISRSDLDLGLVKYEAAELAQHLKGDEAHTFIISSEDLSGHLPWRHGLRNYGAAPKLMQAISLAFEMVFPKAKQTYVFTTREPQQWLRSCYAQHLRAARMTLDEKEYITNFAASADLGGAINQIKAGIPQHDVVSAPLEQYQSTALGPMSAILDLLDLSNERRAALVNPTITNLKPAPSDAQQAALLRLNRSEMDDKSLRKARLEIMAVTR